jgi:hypothetical protein
VIGVDIAIDGADLGAQHPLERDGCRVDHRHLEATLPRRGGDLGADPACPDHHYRSALPKPLAQGVGVLDAPQIQHAVQIGSGDGQPSRLGAGGEQQPVVAHALAAVELELTTRRIEALGGASEAQLDLLLAVEVFVVDVQPFAPCLAAQVVLRQRRTFVGPLGLGADEHDAPIEALLAESRGGSGAGEAGADDHVRAVTCHENSSL